MAGRCELAPADATWRRLAIRVDGAALDGWWRDDAGYVVTVAGEALAERPVASATATARSSERRRQSGWATRQAAEGMVERSCWRGRALS